MINGPADLWRWSTRGFTSCSSEASNAGWKQGKKSAICENSRRKFAVSSSGCSFRCDRNQKTRYEGTGTRRDDLTGRTMVGSSFVGGSAKVVTAPCTAVSNHCSDEKRSSRSCTVNCAEATSSCDASCARPSSRHGSIIPMPPTSMPSVSRRTIGCCGSPWRRVRGVNLAEWLKRMARCRSAVRVVLRAHCRGRAHRARVRDRAP